MRGILLVLFGLAATQNGYAADGGENRAQVDVPRQFGVYAGIGNPYPSLIGINAAYNIDNNLRASLGYGEIEVTTSLSFDSSGGFTEEKMKAQTYSAGLDYLFTDWAVRPVAGLRAGYFSVSGNGSFNIQGVSKSTGLLYSNLGFDWLTRGGFNMGAGLNVAVLGGSGVNFYGNVGYFF